MARSVALRANSVILRVHFNVDPAARGRRFDDNGRPHGPSRTGRLVRIAVDTEYH